MKSASSGLVSGSTFLALAFVFSVPIGWAIATAVLVHVGVLMVLSGGRATELLDSEQPALTKAQIQKALGNGRKKVSRIRKLGKSLPEPALQQKVDGICVIAGKILDDFETDPKGLKVAGRFMDQYLEATLLVIQLYADLSRAASESQEINRVLGEFGELLDSVQSAFARQREKLLSDHALDFDTEMTVLKKLLEMEGG